MVEKDLWLATNFASKLIREGNGRHKAIRISAGYYKVDKDDISEQLSIRQSNGQKGKKRGQYKYYVFSGNVIEEFNENFNEYKETLIIKALNNENARNQVSSYYLERGRVRRRHHIEILKYVTDKEWAKNSKEFENKKEAEEYFNHILKLDSKENKDETRIC